MTPKDLPELPEPECASAYHAETLVYAAEEVLDIQREAYDLGARSTAAQPADRAVGLLREAVATLDMWADVAPAVSLRHDINRFLGEVAAAAQPVEPTVTPTEAVVGFASWVTCRPGTLPAGEGHDAAPWSEAVHEFVVAQGWPTVRDVFPHNLKRPPLSAPPAASGDSTPPSEPADGEQLWLWQNGDHFLAFRHLYPCYSPGGDPMTLGEPFGRAIFKHSHNREGKPNEQQRTDRQGPRSGTGLDLQRRHTPGAGQACSAGAGASIGYGQHQIAPQGGWGAGDDRAGPQPVPDIEGAAGVLAAGRNVAQGVAVQGDPSGALRTEPEAVLHGSVEGDVRALRQMFADCEVYLKEGETPAQRIERERRDTEAVLNLLIREKQRTEAMREVMLRMMAGIDHLAEIARQWEPDHSSGADRRGWVLAKDARDDAARLLQPEPPQASGERGD